MTISPDSPSAAPVDISVVVPTRNRRDLVARLLRQLAALGGALTYEVIVIDEGSTDDTPSLLAEFSRRHGFSVIRNDPPVGLPAARNVGLHAATGEYIAWIDDDDLTAPDRLERQHTALAGGAGRWSCAGRVNINDELEVIGAQACPSPTPGRPFVADLVRFNCLPSAAQGLLVERKLALDVGGFDESLRAAEDWEFCIRLAAASEPHFLDEPLVGYRASAPSMSTDTKRMDTAIAAVLDKHENLLVEHGVTPDWLRIHESLMAADLMSSRWAAVRRGLQVLRHSRTVGGGVRGAIRCTAMVIAPQWWERRSARRRVEQVPAAWRVQAERWLATVERA